MSAIAKHHTPHPAEGGNGDTQNLNQINTALDDARTEFVALAKQFGREILTGDVEAALTNPAFKGIARELAAYLSSSSDSSPELRARATRACKAAEETALRASAWAEARALPAAELVEMLRSKDLYMRGAAQQLLVMSKNPDCIDPLIKAVMDKKSLPNFRERASSVLGEIGNPSCLAALKHEIDRCGSSVAIRAVAKIGGEEAVSILTSLLEDKKLDYMTRREAAFWLGRGDEFPRPMVKYPG